MKDYEIVPIEKLKPLELVFPTHLQNLTKMILDQGVVEMPIYADSSTGIILDGSHRYAFFLGHGYLTVPVKWVDYNNENTRVGTHLAHRFEIQDDVNISKSEVIKRGLSGNLYDPRTTRHFFTFRKEKQSIPLSDLERGPEKNIDHLLPKVSVDDEIKHNEGYLNELEKEKEVVQKYLKEIEGTKQYLQEQVVAMKEGRDANIKQDDLYSGLEN